jgi:hypothetical protein
MKIHHEVTVLLNLLLFLMLLLLFQISKWPTLSEMELIAVMMW